VLALALAAACTSRPHRVPPVEDGGAARAVVERAIAARGGPIAGLVRESDVQVALGFPGGWHWRTVTAPPERYAWTIATNDQPHHYLFDGRVARAFVGDALVSEEPSTASPLATHARFAAVADLDVLRTPAAEVTLAAASPSGATTLIVVFPDRGDRYEVSLGADDLVARVSGPIDLSPIARGQLVATYDDHRPVAARRIARHIHYDLAGTQLADERVTAACILTTPPGQAAFATPATIPTCKMVSTPR
jgi:hypothetical protein